MLLLLSLQAGIWHSLLADSVTLIPVADTTLFATDPTNNLGASTQLVGGSNGNTSPRRALIRFDFSTLPPNAVVQSVTLTLIVTKVAGGVPVASVFDLHRLLVDWKEGTGTGLFGLGAKPGETTWATRFYPSTPWTQPGGAAQSDFSDVVSASTFVDGLGSYAFGSSSNLVADVQQWLSNPQTNFGWILISESEGINFTVRRFASREDTAHAPSLSLVYTVPPLLVLKDFHLTQNAFQFSFGVLAGQAYTVEYRDKLGSGAFLTLTNLPVQNVSTDVLITDPISGTGQRCYRVAAH